MFYCVFEGMGVKGALFDGLEEFHLERKTSKKLEFYCVFVLWLVAAAQREEAQGQPSGNTGAA